MTSDAEKRVFGPVPSRRLGRSLGVDMLPFKTCTFDCVYCQIGRTTNKTTDRALYVPLDPIAEEIRRKLKNGPRPDYITLAGSGEPTLHVQLGEMIRRIQEMTDIPVAVLTNGSLLYLEEVRKACLAADLVIPSLDAGREETFRRINRPCEELTLDKIIGGQEAFRQEFDGAIWLEVFLLARVNDSDEELEAIRKHIERLSPDRVQINTAVRPTAEADAHAAAMTRLEKARKTLGPKAEIIADFHGVHENKEYAARRETILAMLERRPCTLDDIAAGLGVHRNEAVKHVEELVNEGKIVTLRKNKKNFFGSVEQFGDKSQQHS